MQTGSPCFVAGQLVALQVYLAFYWCGQVHHLVVVVGIPFHSFGSAAGMFSSGFDLLGVHFVGYDNCFLGRISWCILDGYNYSLGSCRLCCGQSTCRAQDVNTRSLA